jgi:hypothetical protein
VREMGQSAWLNTSCHTLQGREGKSRCEGGKKLALTTSRLQKNSVLLPGLHWSVRPGQQKHTETGCSKSSFSLCVVCLVHLVSLVYPVSLVQPNKRDKPNRPNNGLLTLTDFISILLRYLESASQSEVTRHRQGLG